MKTTFNSYFCRSKCHLRVDRPPCRPHAVIGFPEDIPAQRVWSYIHLSPSDHSPNCLHVLWRLTARHIHVRHTWILYVLSNVAMIWHFVFGTLWRSLLPYEYSCKASCVIPGLAVICNFWHPRALWRSALSARVPRYQKLRMTAKPGMTQDAL